MRKRGIRLERNVLSLKFVAAGFGIPMRADETADSSTCPSTRCARSGSVGMTNLPLLGGRAKEDFRDSR
jgi:hypothetical protein